MKKPTHLTVVDPAHPNPRMRDDVVAMAMVTQANLVQLKVADCRRRKVDPAEHTIHIVSPGHIAAHREALIDHRLIRGYDDASLQLRLHEVWGQYCLFCWLLHVDDVHRSPGFSDLDDAVEVRCASAIELKEAEIEGWLWRLQVESRVRAEPGDRDSEDRASEYRVSDHGARVVAAAEMIPAQVSGQDVSSVSDQALLASCCEYAGMLAAIRWMGDLRRSWGEQGIMDVDEARMMGMDE